MSDTKNCTCHCGCIDPVTRGRLCSMCKVGTHISRLPETVPTFAALSAMTAKNAAEYHATMLDKIREDLAK
jgi:hypothetical protein